jgi:hypothetical protein
MGTEAKKTIAEALLAAQQSAQAVAKGSKNSFHNYKYASSEAIIEEAREALTSAGLAVCAVGSLLRREGEHVTVVSQFHLSVGGGVEGGDLVVTYETPAILEKGRPWDKAVAAARTYALAYFLRDLLLLPRVEEEQIDRRDDRKFEPRKAEPKGEALPGLAPASADEYIAQALSAANAQEVRKLYKLALHDPRIEDRRQEVLDALSDRGTELKGAA